jgi:hypothetical protein
MDSCDRRTHAYKNGKTFEQCVQIAETVNIELQRDIEKNGKILWKELLEKVNHDELVYKLFDIGNSKIPEVKKFTHA